MDQQRLAGGQVRQDVFRPPPQAFDTRARQPVGHPVGQRPAQVGPPDVGLRDDAPLHHGHKAAADSFNLGQFRHGGPGGFVALQARQVAYKGRECKGSRPE